MKYRKLTSILGIAIFTMAIASSTFAQSSGSNGGAQPASVAKTRHPLLNALNLVNLTPDQHTKINFIITTKERNDKAFKKTHKGDVLAIQAHNVAEEKTMMDGIKGVLTPAQWQQVTALLHRNKKGK